MQGLAGLRPMPRAATDQERSAGGRVPIAGTAPTVLVHPMSSPDYYRREAQRCRDLAASSPDPEAARRWRAIAAEYEDLAEAMEDVPPPSSRRAGVQRQPMQQQQKKAGEDESGA
jgi:hypothetical protein